MNNNLPAGQIKIEDIRIVTFDGQDQNILNSFREVEIIEDINSSMMYGRIIMTEPNNLVESLPIVGEEFIVLKYSTPTDKDAPVRSLEFRISGVSNLYKPKDKQFDYELNFVSPEYFHAVQMSVDVRKTALTEEMVNELLKINISTEKQLTFEPTSRRQTILFPGMSIMDAINYCMFRSESRDKNDSLYKFFETPDGFNLVSIGHLNKQDPVIDIEYKQVGVEEIGDTPIAAFSAFNYSIKNRSDTAYAVHNGGYKNSVLLFDPLLKKIDYKTKNYFDNDNVQTENKMINNFTFENVVGIEDSIEYAFVTNLRQQPRENSVDPSDMYVPGYGDFYLNRQMARVRLNDTIVEATIPATTRLICGDTVNFNIPKDNSTDGASENDRYASGKYLLTKVVHTIGPERGITTLEMRKSGFQNEIERG